MSPFTDATFPDYKYPTLDVKFVAENVLHVILNRPQALNAMSRQFWKDFRECFEAIANDSRVRAVVISANGRIFTAGLDLKDAAPTDMGGAGSKDVARKAYHLRREILEIQQSFNNIEFCNKPSETSIRRDCDCRRLVDKIGTVSTLPRLPYILCSNRRIALGCDWRRCRPCGCL